MISDLIRIGRPLSRFYSHHPFLMSVYVQGYNCQILATSSRSHCVHEVPGPLSGQKDETVTAFETYRKHYGENSDSTTI